MTEDRCIACGTVVPEGRQVCPDCEDRSSIKQNVDNINKRFYRHRGGRVQKPIVYICSPYRGDVKRNVMYAQELTKWALRKGYAPIVPQLYLPQVLDDEEPSERAIGLEAGLALLKSCDLVIVGKQFGISEGMAAEIREAARLCIPLTEV